MIISQSLRSIHSLGVRFGIACCRFFAQLRSANSCQSANRRFGLFTFFLPFFSLLTAGMSSKLLLLMKKFCKIRCVVCLMFFVFFFSYLSTILSLLFLMQFLFAVKAVFHTQKLHSSPLCFQDTSGIQTEYVCVSCILSNISTS